MLGNYILPVNKRLDEWVDESRMKLDEVQGPRKPDVKTPVKGQGAVGSRPPSPSNEHSQSSTPAPASVGRRGPPSKKKKLEDVSRSYYNSFCFKSCYY